MCVLYLYVKGAVELGEADVPSRISTSINSVDKLALDASRRVAYINSTF